MSETLFDTGSHLFAWLPVDLDGDGYEPPEDCDDEDENIHPGATDVPYNAVDEDCDGSDLVDVDGDGWDATAVGGDDCADANASIHPDAEELCGDGRDNDCDGEADEDCATIDPADPGGLSWTCSHGGGPVLGALPVLVVLLAVLHRVRDQGSLVPRPPGSHHTLRAGQVSSRSSSTR
jgi:hypothetical protein